MSTAKNKGGRPARAPGEKMTRLSVVLRSRYRDALDLIARDRQTSLSQALEYLIAVGARNYEIDGKSVMSLVVPGDDPQSILDQLEWPDFPTPVAGMKEKESQARTNVFKQNLQRKMDEARSTKVMRMPASLRRPEENYFAEAMDQIGGRINGGPYFYDNMLDSATECYKAGIAVEDFVQAVLKRYASMISDMRAGRDSDHPWPHEELGKRKD